MGTPAAVLGEFWAELREKSRVRIEHPDLPGDLRDAAGELVATLWTRATASAQAELDALRGEVEGQRAEAEQRVEAEMLQKRLAARREADSVAPAAPAKTAPARPAVARPARTPGPLRKVAVASAPSSKMAVRRKKRG